jgi:hypothetical protein
MGKFDINDPYDLDIMKAQFDMISHEEWDDYIEIGEERKLGYKNLNILKSASRKAGMGKYLSPKVLNWVLSLVDQLDEEE